MYYPSSENKSADQLRGYREADLRLCFRLCRLLVFPWDGSNVGSLELDIIQNGSLTDMQHAYGILNIVHPFAGALDPEFILMFEYDQLRRARGVGGFLGRE